MNSVAGIDCVHETVECFACVLKSAFVYKSTSIKKLKHAYKLQAYCIINFSFKQHMLRLGKLYIATE